LVGLIGDARLRERRFTTRESRLANLDELMAVIRPWFAVRRKADIYREAKLRNIPLGPVWTISDLLSDAQYLERDFLAITPAGVMPRLPVMWNGRRP
jgi:crotonobetainyl-CoA:carnitine CoA-transferase CaiB-like acyl-CoA transferase